MIAANILLGLNQGFAWSMTVIMKVDLVGPKSRGLAVGLNEFAGYLAVGVTAFLTGYLASQYGLRPAPIYLGAAYAIFGLVAGMWVQAAGLFLTAATSAFQWWLVGSLLLGIGTAMVYPSLIAAVSDASHPTWRARSLSVYRFWRDLGYALGALAGGAYRRRFRARCGHRLDCSTDLPVRRPCRPSYALRKLSDPL